MQKTREQVDLKNTWDLTLIYKTEEDFEKDFAKLPQLLSEICKFKGTLASTGTNLLRFLQADDELSQLTYKIYVYRHLQFDQDLGNNVSSANMTKVRNYLAKMSAELSFAKTEISAISDEDMERMMQEEKGLEMYRHSLEERRLARKHVLSESEESLIANLSPVLSTAEEIFSMINDSDIKFEDIIDKDGEKKVLTHSMYNVYLRSEDRELRRQAYDNLYASYKQLRNTLAKTLSNQVKLHNISASLRSFPSARAAALFANTIDEKVYDNLITTVKSRISLLHRYVALRKKVLQVENLQPYDMYSPLIKDVKHEYSIEEAKEILIKALAPLGEEYITNLKKAFDERWIDFVDNKGKRSGAYSSGCYGTRPYILISWQGTLDNLFTLAHELGHSMHSFYTWETQPYVYGSYSIFLAEIASTTNENLLTQYLLQTVQDKDKRLSIINDYIEGVKGTVFRQTQFADFEQTIHLLDQEGVVLTADELSKRYAELNKEYYGEALTENENISLEWSRIPHFYYDFYVYQYATGFSAATAFSKAILSEGQPAVERYMQFLKAGCSDYPIEVLKKSGLDMTTPAVVEACLDTFEQYLNLFEKELDQLQP